jgi:hypothetical protein
MAASPHCSCATVDAASRIIRSRFVCTNCGSIFDANVNAAKNILKLGISPTGGLPGMACESSQSTGRKQEEDARKGVLGPSGPRVVTSGSCFIEFQIGHHFLDTMLSASMSLCMTDCWLRLSHFNVTPDQFVSVTVAWSFLSSRQQTREPILKDLDSEPVIRFSVSVLLCRSSH